MSDIENRIWKVEYSAMDVFQYHILHTIYFISSTRKGAYVY